MHQLLSPALSPPSALSHLAVIIADDYAFCGSQAALGIRSVFLVPSEPGTWLGASWVVGSGLGEGGMLPMSLVFMVTRLTLASSEVIDSGDLVTWWS